MEALVKKKRTEDKYLLTQAQYLKLLPKVKANMPKFAYDEESPNQSKVFSYYLDSPDLVSFKKHVAGDDTRWKVRVRTYENDGVPHEHWYIEIKEKLDGNDQKSRIQITPEMVGALKRGETLSITPQLKKLNNSLDGIELRGIVDRMNVLMRGYNLSPSLDVEYTREAYGTTKLRVTFDRNLVFTAKKFNTKLQAKKVKGAVDWDIAKEMALLYKPGDVILEIKHEDQDPAWLVDSLKEMDLEPQSFSKYVRSVYWLIRGLLKDEE